MNDLISRQSAIDALAKHEESQGHNYSMFRSVVSECEEIIRDLPFAEPKTGKWIPVSQGMHGGYYECIECGNRALYAEDGVEELSKHCPACGARMTDDD